MVHLGSVSLQLLIGLAVTTVTVDGAACTRDDTKFDIAFLIDVSYSLMSNATLYKELKETLMSFVMEAEVEKRGNHIGIYPFADNSIYEDSANLKYVLPLYRRMGPNSARYSYDTNKIKAHLDKLEELTAFPNYLKDTFLKKALQNLAKDLYTKARTSDRQLKVIMLTDAIIKDINDPETVKIWQDWKVSTEKKREMEVSVIVVGEEGTLWSLSEQQKWGTTKVVRAHTWSELHNVIKDQEIYLELCMVHGGWGDWFDVGDCEIRNCEVKLQGVMEMERECDSSEPYPEDDDSVMCVTSYGESDMVDFKEDACEVHQEDWDHECEDHSVFCMIPPEHTNTHLSCTGPVHEQKIEETECVEKFLSTKSAVAFTYDNYTCTLYGPENACEMAQGSETFSDSATRALKRLCVLENERVTFLIDTSASTSLQTAKDVPSLLSDIKDSVHEFIHAMPLRADDDPAAPLIAVNHFNTNARRAMIQQRNMTSIREFVEHFPTKGPLVGGESNILNALAYTVKEVNFYEVVKRSYLLVLTGGDLNQLLSPGDFLTAKKYREQIEARNYTVLFFGMGELMENKEFVDQLKSLAGKPEHVFIYHNVIDGKPNPEKIRHFVTNSFITSFCEKCSYDPNSWVVTDSSPAAAKREAQLTDQSASRR